MLSEGCRRRFVCKYLLCFIGYAWPLGSMEFRLPGVSTFQRKKCIIATKQKKAWAAALIMHLEQCMLDLFFAFVCMYKWATLPFTFHSSGIEAFYNFLDLRVLQIISRLANEVWLQIMAYKPVHRTALTPIFPVWQNIYMNTNLN